MNRARVLAVLRPVLVAAAACLVLAAGPALAGSAAPGSVRAGSPVLHGQVSLMGVSCPTASFCLAVGKQGSSGGYGPVSQDWNGKTWRILDPPARPADSYLTDRCLVPEQGELPGDRYQRPDGHADLCRMEREDLADAATAGET